MNFLKFSETAERIKNTDGNIDTKNEVLNLISDADENNIGIVCRFIQGRIFPENSNKKTGFSVSLMKSAISECTEHSTEDIDEKLVEVEDMGGLFDILDIKTTSGQQTLVSSNLTVKEVYDTFESIAEEEGSGSQKRKTSHMVSLISRSSPIEAKYVTRLILDDMKIGVGESTVQDALSDLFNVDSSLVERAMMFKNDIGYVASIAYNTSTVSSTLKHIEPAVTRNPLKSMKAKKSTPYEVFDDIGSDTVIGDFKYDGFRIQIHKNKDNIQLFTRQLENVTESLPDVVETIRDNVSADEVILDAEVVGFESENYRNPIEYQKTQQRIRRKYDIEEMMQKIPVQPRVFDILYYDNEGGVIIDNPLSDRIDCLNLVCDSSILTERQICHSQKDVENLIEKALNSGHEGCMIKDPDSGYEPNSRGKKWLKLKPEGETIDAIIIGGEYGDGRKSEFISSYQIGLLNENTGDIECIGDVANGVNDEELRKLTDMLEDNIVTQDGEIVEVQPSIVIEVQFEDVQNSPEYDSGYSLRFPTVENIRYTKGKNNFDTISRLENISDI